MTNTTPTLLQTSTDLDRLLELLSGVLYETIAGEATLADTPRLIPQANYSLQVGPWHIELVPYDSSLSYHQHAYLTGLRFVQSDLTHAIVVIDDMRAVGTLSAQPASSYRTLHYRLTDVHDPSFAEKALHCVVLQSV